MNLTSGTELLDFGILSSLVYKDTICVKGKKINQDDVDAYYEEHNIENPPQITSEYIVIKPSEALNGFQGMLVQDDVTKEYTFVFRGTDENMDWVSSDIPMFLDSMPDQMFSVVSFVMEMINQYHLDATNTTFAGHSLGGSLAG